MTLTSLSRRLATTFAAVFVMGLVAGALLAMNFGDLRFYRFLSRTNDPASFAQRLDQKIAAQYRLDAGEQERIAPLTKDMAQHLYALRRKFATDVLQSLDASHKKIAAEMSPAHRAAYEKDNLDRQKRAASMLIPTAKDAPPGNQP